MALPDPGWVSQPSNAPVTPFPLPSPRLFSYRDGNVETPAASLVVYRARGGAEADIAGGHDAEMQPALDVTMRVFDAYSALLMDRTEIAGAQAWATCRGPERPPAEWPDCS